MNDEQVTNPAKTLGRRKTYTEGEAATAYDLYVVKDLPGKQVAKAMDRPRTTVIEMAREHASRLEGAHAPDRAEGQLPSETDQPGKSNDTDSVSVA